ncbi:MAG TPA: T9SS type B sorting domain-containing protein, partial [Chitinophagaceae bacterium]|nr:T9SS type B sorting domain-containing protein [Chitinophagaceae bacterium]
TCTTADLTAASVTAGSDAGLIFTYFSDAAATTAVTNPKAVVPGTYYIKGTAGACFAIKSVVVSASAAPMATVSGGTFCATGTTTLTTTGATGGTFSASPAGLNINAATGVINLATSIPGTYTITYAFGTAPCNGTATSQVTVSAGITPNFTVIGPLCQNSTAPILPTTSLNNITGTWSPATINTSTTGSSTYTFKPNAGVCATTFKMDIVVATPMPPIRYTTINASANAPKQLQARTITPNDKYTWSPSVGLDNYSINTPVFNYDRSVEYLISIDVGTACTVVDTLLVKVFPFSGSPAQLSEIFGPKAFSPNGDGHNDKLTPLLFKIKEFKYFRVYNRWGQLVFETNIRGEGWDGTFKGQPLGTDVFTWTVEAIGTDGGKHVKKGTSILLR